MLIIFKLLSVLLLTVFSFSIITMHAHADTQRIVNYNYDGAGNIISIRSGQNQGPPDVTLLSPAFIHKESFAFVTATGINLFQAAVSVNTPGMSLIEVTHISETEIKLTLFADTSAQIGLAPISFSTRLGSDSEDLFVTERTPVVSTDPNPIILAPDNQTIPVKLTFDQPFTSDQLYDIKITDGRIASVSNQQVTLLAGTTQVSISIAGLTAGFTTLEINQLSNFLALGIPVVVSDQSLPDGIYTQYTDLVGVSTFIKQALNTNGPFVTQSVGVAIFIDQAPNTNGPFVTQPVGVATFIDQALNTNGPFVTSHIGSTFGTVVDQVTPHSITQASSATLIINGLDLNSVTAVSFSPADGITQTGVITTNSEGTEITITIDIASNALISSRTIIFTTDTGDQVFTEGVFDISD